MHSFHVTLVVLFASICLTFAIPVPLQDDSTVELKRMSHAGRGTWFNVGLGNCGGWNKDADRIVAIPKALYDQNNGNNCNEWMEIVNDADGHKVYAMVRDSCPSCGPGDLDMSPATFKALASLGTGVIQISWHFMGKSWRP